jgi:hypothetical protein
MSDAQPNGQSNARKPLLDFLRKHYKRVPEDASVNELARMARPFSRNESGCLDPMIEHLIHCAEIEEAESRQRRASRTHGDVPSAAALKQHDDRMYACINAWAKQHLYNWINAWVEHNFSTCADAWFERLYDEQLREAAAELLVDERERARNELNKKIDEVEKLLLTEVVNAANARLASTDKTAERIAALEQHVTALTRDEADTKQLRERTSELETTLWTREEKHAAQAAASEQAIAVAQRETADTRQELKQFGDRLRDLEMTFAREQKDSQRLAESERATNQKITVLEAQLAEAREIHSTRCQAVYSCNYLRASAASEHNVGTGRERCCQQCPGRDGHQSKNQEVQNEELPHGIPHLLSGFDSKTGGCT